VGQARRVGHPNGAQGDARVFAMASFVFTCTSRALAPDGPFRGRRVLFFQTHDVIFHVVHSRVAEFSNDCSHGVDNYLINFLIIMLLPNETNWEVRPNNSTVPRVKSKLISRIGL
jgi:hypothetical protein